ncbi:hypothetical protein [Candidatus Skiveiella danica]|uniref:hypothetical protein n=1 Tax=Candidatus Skiveiella danica TaxID=3386177 RepID=UPI0039B88A7B
MRENVTMECGHSPAPGMDWNVTVSFVGNAKMYRVWSRSDEDQNRVLLKQAAGPLTWRRMVADIKELDEIGLGGDLLSDIQVSGLTGWQSSLLKMAWCKFEGPAERQLEFLLDLPDETIALFEEKLGDLTDPVVLAALDEVIEAKEELQISMTQVDQAINETTKAMRKGLDPWVRSMSDWFQAYEVFDLGPGVSMEVARRSTTAETLAIATTMQSPLAVEVARVLLVNWSKAEPKPVQEGNVGGIRFRSTIPFLQWLVQRLEPGALASVAAHADGHELNAMEALDAHIAAEINRLRTSRGGGALGHGVRGGIVASWERLRRQVFGSG